MEENVLGSLSFLRSVERLHDCVDCTKKTFLGFQSLQASSVTRTNTLRDVFSFPVLIF